MKNQQNQGEIIIYKSDTGPELELKLRDNTIWLNQDQIANLFGTQRPAITKHLKNIFREAELSQNSVSSILELTASDGKVYKVQHYNLDAVISIGYRVNSKRATQFRIWATKRLRDYLLKGYLVNEKRLRENQTAKLRELQQAHALIQQALETKRLDGYEKELLNIIADYTNTWVVLNEYDSGKLKLSDVTRRKPRFIDYDQIKDSIERFKKRLIASNEASELFGSEVGNKLAQILGSVRQSFDGVDVYPSVEEKAAHLFYFAVKDHPFVDGNKRIGSLMFILFLVENRLLYNRRGEKRINDSALAALALLVAESKPQQKDVMIKLIVNLINKK